VGARHPPDRATILASLRDYVEQIREEGMPGLPPGQSSALSGLRTSGRSTAPQSRSSPAATDAGVTPEPPGSAASPTPAAIVTPGSAAPGIPSPLLARYPGLDKTLDLAQLVGFIGDCQRCKLAPRRTHLVFGVGNPAAELMFIGEAPGADEDASRSLAAPVSC
jgi:hypothetical protein